MAVARARFDIRQSGRPLLLVLVALFVLDLGFYIGFVQPAVRKYERLRTTSQPRFDELEERRARVEERERFVAAIRQAEKDLTRLRDEVLATRAQRLVQVQFELVRLAGQFGIDVDSVSTANSVLPNEGLDRMEMVVPLEGGYANLRRFLQAVENSDKFLIVERVGLAEGKDGGALLQLNITLATYFAASPEVLMATRER